MENLFQNISDLKEREQAMRDNAYEVKELRMQFPFTLDQLSEFKEQLTNKSILNAEKVEELKKISAPLKEEIKDLNASIKELCKNLKNKYDEREDMVYHFDDQQEGVMLLYNAQGEFLGSRKLLPSEKQTKITSIKKTA